jgi:antitoxin component YwqK of YwqJK toxin-antitoxin module
MFHKRTKVVLFSAIAIILLSCAGRNVKKVVESYADGTLKRIFYYKIDRNDSILIKEISYYQNNNPRLQGEFVDDSLYNGLWTFWYEKGQKLCEARFEKGKRIGDWNIWGFDGKQLVAGDYELKETGDGFPETIKFLKSTQKGVELSGQIDFYPNHSIKSAGPAKDNKKFGLWTAWFNDGTKWSEGEFKYDVADGIHTVWYQNGQKYYEGKYFLGEKVGPWKFWNEKGKLLREVNYERK